MTKSLESAQEALVDLRKEGGRSASQGARDINKELRTVLSGAKRYSGRLATALERDFERAQKELSRRVASTTGIGKAATSSRRSSGGASKRSSRSSSSRSGSSRSGGGQSGGSRSGSARRRSSSRSS